MGIFKDLAKRYADKKEHKELLRLALEITTHLETDAKSADIIGRLNAMTEREKIIDNHHRRYELLVYEALHNWKHSFCDHKIALLYNEVVHAPNPIVGGVKMGRVGDEPYVECTLELQYKDGTTLYFNDWKFPKSTAANKELAYEDLFKVICIKGIGGLLRKHLNALKAIEDKQKQQEFDRKEAIRKKQELSAGAVREREIATAKMLDKYNTEPQKYTPDQYAQAILKAVKVQQEPEKPFKFDMNDFMKVFVNPKTREIYHFFLGNVFDRVEKEMYEKRDPRVTLKHYQDYLPAFKDHMYRTYRLKYNGNMPVTESVIEKSKRLAEEEQLRQAQARERYRQGQAMLRNKSYYQKPSGLLTSDQYDEWEWDMLYAEGTRRGY